MDNIENVKRLEHHIDLLTQEQANTDRVIDNAIVALEIYIDGQSGLKDVNETVTELLDLQMARQARETWKV